MDVLYDGHKLGFGGLYLAELVDLAQDECIVKIVEEILDVGMGRFSRVVGQGMIIGLPEGLPWRLGSSEEGLGHV